MEQCNHAAGAPIIVSVPWPDYYGGMLAELPVWPLQATITRLAADAERGKANTPINPRSRLWRAGESHRHSLDPA